MRRRGNISRRCMAAIISAVMLMSTGAVAFPMGVYADTYYLENGSVTVEAKDDGSQYVTQADNNINSVEDADPIISTDDPNVEKNTLAADGSTTNTITINAEAGQTANVTLKDVNIDVSATEDAKAVDITGTGDVIVELDGDNVVKSGENAAGVQKENAGTLTITDTAGTNEGSITATGGLLAAGIGGGKQEAGSDITITGNATVTATGGECGAGIGGGLNSEGSNITISGDSTVTATSLGACGSAIGGGHNAAGKNITITGNATVTATGGSDAAGIGGGCNKEGENITITGNATVTATGGRDAAGIGGGYHGAGSNINISGDTIVTATGGSSGAGIGGGLNSEGSNITISGDSTVTATGGKWGAGIGGGDTGAGTNITITDNSTVIATGGSAAAGIGGGEKRNGNEIRITGNSTVIATGGNSMVQGNINDVCGGTGIGNGFGGNNSMPVIQIADSASVYVSPGKSEAGYPETPAIGIAPFGGFDGNNNPTYFSGTELSETNLLAAGFTGNLTKYEPGTTTDLIRAIVFPNVQPPINPSGTKTSDQTTILSDNTNNTENNDTDSNYTDNASSYQGITPAMLTRLINGLMGTSKSGVITIDFGRNICLTPEIMKILAETGNGAKNCSFIYKNKKYNLYIPIIDKNTNAYKDAMEVLKKEDNNRGFAGFMRVYEIYRDLGVTLQEIK